MAAIAVQPATKEDEIRRLRETQPGIVKWVDKRKDKPAEFFEEKLRDVEKTGNTKRIEGAQTALRYYLLISAEKAEQPKPAQEAVKAIPIAAESQAPPAEAVKAIPIAKDEAMKSNETVPAKEAVPPEAEKGGIRELITKTVGDAAPKQREMPVDAATKKQVTDALEDNTMPQKAGKAETPTLEELSKLTRSGRWRTISNKLAILDDEKLIDAYILALKDAKKWNLISDALAATENEYTIRACVLELKTAKKWNEMNTALRGTENDETAADCVLALKGAEMWEPLGMTLAYATYGTTVELCLKALIDAEQWEEIDRAFLGTKNETTKELIMRAYKEYERQPPVEDEEVLPPEDDETLPPPDEDMTR